MNHLLDKVKRLIQKAEEKEIGLKLGMFLLIALLFWFFFLGDNPTKDEYRGGYGGSDYLD